MTSLRLEPDVNLLSTYIRAKATWQTVLAELVDNAWDEDAGNGSTVVIGISHDALEIIDDGIGVRDINMLGRLGASGSRDASGKSIGQYGIGSKTWLTKARRLDVDTVRDGIRHRHSFRVPKKAGWLHGYTGKGKPSTDPSGTLITLRDFYRTNGPFNIQVLVDALSQQFWSGLRDGKKISIVDTRRSEPRTFNVEVMSPPEWTDRLVFESQVNGRPYRAELGILGEGIPKYRGLFISYLHRTICVHTGKLATRTPSPRIHGQISLGPEWKETLSHYKDAIVSEKDWDDLLADIETKASELLSNAEQRAFEMELNIKSLQLTNLAQNVFRAKGIAGNGSGGTVLPFPTIERRKDKTEDTHEKLMPDRKPKVRTGTPEGDRAPSSGLILKIEWGDEKRDMTCEVSIDGNSVSVLLNRNSRMLNPSEHAPYPGTFNEIGHAIANFICADMNMTDARRLFGAMLGNVDDGANLELVRKSVIAWWHFDFIEQARSIPAAVRA